MVTADSAAFIQLFDALYAARSEHEPTTRERLFLALVEEVGEVSRAIAEGEPQSRIDAEIRDVAVVCLRLLTDAKDRGSM